MKRIRYLLLAVFTGVLLLGGGAVAGKTALERAATAKAQEILGKLQAERQPPERLALALTRQVHVWYSKNRTIENPSLLWRLKPYLTHELVPEVFRLPAGLIDTLYVEGICDDATRTLGYILGEAGIESRQLNIVNRFSGAHSVLLAHFPDGREVILDPLYGIVPQLNGVLLSPEDAQEASKAIDASETLWHKLAPTSNDSFYRDFTHAVFAAQNAGLEIEVPVSLNGEEAIVLGRPDGDSQDVHKDGLSRSLTHYWTYLGHKHDRGWIRVLVFAQDTRMEIGLVDPVNADFITTDARPNIEGNVLTYEVGAGQSLRFVDGLAKRDWTRLKSYQDIDYIRFEPLR